MSSVFHDVWNGWVSRTPEGYQLDSYEMSWLMELNLACFSYIETELARKSQQLRAAPSARFQVEMKPGINHEVTMSTRQLCVLPEAAPIEVASTSIVRDVLQLIGASPVTYIYTPIFPLGKTWIDGTPNRRGMAIRIATL